MDGRALVAKHFVAVFCEHQRRVSFQKRIEPFQNLGFSQIDLVEQQPPTIPQGLNHQPILPAPCGHGNAFEGRDLFSLSFR